MSQWLWLKLQQFYVDTATSLALSLANPPLKQKTMKNMRYHKTTGTAFDFISHISFQLFGTRTFLWLH